MLKIVLDQQDGEAKTITKKFATTRDMRTYLEYVKKMNPSGKEEGEKVVLGNSIESIDEAIDVMVEIFENPEVTTENILLGLPSAKFWETFNTMAAEIMGAPSEEEGKKE
ncbi:hypothetical protein RAK27_11765 [Carnobacterium maltaromaticum]|uniref:Phage protein n=1 Tax=Carnobacterium maltaromaticum TaxID=2751 RepID=A0AAW9K458_CARML|nr:hypothetical protein [Carnobacterium maltaromaticum]MDZ5759340.1 hypothetical protein [Carnobacterium maltaromaticum]